MINDTYFLDRRKKNYRELKIRERLISICLGLFVALIGSILYNSGIC